MSFYKDRQVLVTGAGGFIASHLVEDLVNLGANVRALVRYNSRGNIGLLGLLSPEILDKVEIVFGDLRDMSTMREAVEGVSFVFHLGALIAIPYSYLHPEEVVETNVMGTLNVLLAARAAKVRRVVHTSTSEVYGTALRVPIDETHPLQGQSPYSASKIGADKIAESFYKSYNCPIVTVRPFNTYGPRQSARAVIPTIITQALTLDTVKLGNLKTKRDLTYVSDTVKGFILAGQIPNLEGQTINLGTGKEVSIEDLVQVIIALVGRPVKVMIDEKRIRPEKSEVQRLLSDNRLAFQTLGWKPEIELEDGLSNTVSWISKNLEYYQPGKYQV